jgi:hypothetical protein
LQALIGRHAFAEDRVKVSRGRHGYQKLSGVCDPFTLSDLKSAEAAFSDTNRRAWP